ncbi:hypothetical protein, partial [Caballeronia sp. ATUFL_F1_KS4A]|uniref:hypothetical protein n=1 Tax=Caballeronia sp. ATUFL_F1_KS4A TaxID=2921768 RepID=UPI00202898E2
IKAYDAITKRLQVMGATITPEQVQALVMQTVQQALVVQPEEPQPEQYEMQQFPANMDAGMPPQMPAEMPPEMPEPMGMNDADA